jgi:hypothetical protein
MAIGLEQTFGTGGSPSTFVAVGAQVVTLTTSWAAFAVTFTVPSISGKTLGTNNNDSLLVTAWTSAGSDYNSRFATTLGLQTIGVDLWGVHIKVGTHTTAATALYKQPELGPELARCQRYYWSLKSAAANGNYLRYVFGSAISTTSTSFVLIPPTTMRATPALSSTGSFGVWDGVSVHPTTGTVGIGTDGSSNEVINIGATTATAVLTQFRPYQLLSNNNSTSALAFDAEL